MAVLTDVTGQLGKSALNVIVRDLERVGTDVNGDSDA